MMTINRRRQSQETLQEDVSMCCGQKVLAPDHMAHCLKRVVVHHSEMVARRGILAPEYDVAEEIWPHLVGPTFRFWSNIFGCEFEAGEFFAQQAL